MPHTVLEELGRAFNSFKVWVSADILQNYTTLITLFIVFSLKANKFQKMVIGQIFPLIKRDSADSQSRC